MVVFLLNNAETLHAGNAHSSKEFPVLPRIIREVLNIFFQNKVNFNELKAVRNVCHGAISSKAWLIRLFQTNLLLRTMRKVGQTIVFKQQV